MPGARAAATGEGLPPRPPSATPGPGRQTFEDSMVHEVLCVTRRFTACCALHRCLSRGVLHDDVSGSRLGAGTPRDLSVSPQRRNATRRLPRLSGLTPFFTGFSAAWQPRRERRLPSALPQRAFGTDSSTPSPPVLLSCASFLLEPPASPKRTARGRRRRCHCCVSTVPRDSRPV